LRKSQPDFSEKRFGYGGFLQFCKAARARGHIEMEWDPAADDYIVRALEPGTVPTRSAGNGAGPDAGDGATAPGADGETAAEPASDSASKPAKAPAKKRGRR
jgi:hypothetical protein